MPQAEVQQTDTRRKIIDAVMVVAAKEGFDRATTQQISRQAGVSEGIIYHYFRSKDELCANMVREKSAELRAHVVDGISNIPSPGKRLERLIDLHIEMVTGRGGLFRVLFSRVGGAPIIFKEALKNGILPYSRIIEGIIKEGINKGVFKPVDPKITALNLIGMMQITLIAILLEEVPFTAKEAKENIKKLFFGGILK
ncbi:MAG: TetR/AcrR family transcriptional regulator [Candidatus Omnitrophota bacterium]|jgi:TetR/AcrR family fatty acid metabolism transcriptional regulator